MTIYKYQKIITDFTTYFVRTLEGSGITELCTIDGETYLHVPGEQPEQPEQITIEEVVLTDDLKASIKDASPHVRLIRQKVVDKIREKYSLNDELKIMSLYFVNPEDPIIQECSDYKVSCRAWGQAEKAKIGL